MMSLWTPRYQVFVSSTFTDLVEERHAVREAILELAHFPAGMEIFPAADATPWELIEQIISGSDYYIVIIGGRYGSVDEDGISFTEREYDLAQKLSKPTLAFLHRDPEIIPAGKVELTARARKKLGAFKKKALEGHLCKHWSTRDDLKSVVMLSLIHTFRTKPGRGWIRAGGPDITETLARLANLQQRHDELARENAELRGAAGAPISGDLAGGDEMVEIEFSYSMSDPVEKSRHKTKVLWNLLFHGMAEELVTESPKYEIERALNRAIAVEIWQTPLSDEMTKRTKPKDFSEFSRGTDITDDSFTMIMLQFIALGSSRCRPSCRSDRYPDKVHRSSWSSSGSSPVAASRRTSRSAS
jgi:hypothetical protein